MLHFVFVPLRHQASLLHILVVHVRIGKFVIEADKPCDVYWILSHSSLQITTASKAGAY